MFTLLRPFFLIAVLLFPLSQATSEPMTLEEFYKQFVSSDVYIDARKDVDFFVETTLKDPQEIEIYDYLAFPECSENYKEGNDKNIPTDKCYKGSVYFKVEFRVRAKRLLLSSETEEVNLKKEEDKNVFNTYELGYVSGVIDFEDLEVLAKILLIEASFFAPRESLPVLVLE